MSAFKVQPQQVKDWMSELEGLRGRFENIVTKLESEGNLCACMWEGPANEEFKKWFRSDVSAMRAYNFNVQAYVTALQEILATYKTHEQANVAVGGRR
jgi:uncharacterized protein YukE